LLVIDDKDAVGQRINDLESKFMRVRYIRIMYGCVVLSCIVANWFEYFMTFELLKRLNQFDVTQEEFSELKRRLKDIRTETVADFVTRQTRKPIVFSKKWEKDIQNAVRFYEIAELRHEEVREHLNWFKEGVFIGQITCRATSVPSAWIMGSF